MYIINLLNIDITSLVLATAINIPAGYVDGNYLPHACIGFASAAELVVTEVKTQGHSFPDFLNTLNNIDIGKTKRERIEQAVQWVYSNEINNPVVAKQTAMAMCLGKKNKSDDPMNEVKLSGPF